MEKIKLFEVGDEQIHLSPLKPLYANQSLRGGYYYSASDVDAMLADVRRLVEAAKNALPWIETRAQQEWENLYQAIAAVERHFPNKTSQP